MLGTICYISTLSDTLFTCLLYICALSTLYNRSVFNLLSDTLSVLY